jgi:hypothetical protein
MPKGTPRTVFVLGALLLVLAGCPRQEMLQVRPHCIHFKESAAASGEPLLMQVFNGNFIGGNPLTFTLTPSAAWIVPDQTSGTSNSRSDLITILVSITEGFEAEGFITVTSNAGTDRVDVFVEPDK